MKTVIVYLIQLGSVKSVHIENSLSMKKLFVAQNRHQQDMHTMNEKF